MSESSTIPITVGTTLIQFPNSGASPLWSEAIIEFAQTVATQLQTIISPFDVAPTVQILTSNANTGLLLNGNGVDLTFPTGSIRSFIFTYGIYRVTTGSGTVSITDVGTVTGIFNNTTLAWGIEHEFSGDTQTNGQAWNIFDVNSSNQLTLSTTALPTGVYDTVNSTISYSVTTQLVSNP